MTVDVENY